MSLSSVFRNTIPIESFTKKRVVKDAPVETPDVGLRWGKPSNYYTEDERENQKSQNFIVVTPHENRHFVGNEIRREFKQDEINIPDADSLAVEAIEDTTFYCGIRKEFTEISAGALTIRDEVIIHQYVRINIPLATTLGSGVRGDPAPIPTPEFNEPTPPEFQE